MDALAGEVSAHCTGRAGPAMWTRTIHVTTTRPTHTTLTAPRNTQPEKKMKKITAQVWDFVTKTPRSSGDVIHKCQQCSTKFTLTSSTSNIRSYLKRHGLLLQNKYQMRIKISGALKNSPQLPLDER